MHALAFVQGPSGKAAFNLLSGLAALQLSGFCKRGLANGVSNFFENETEENDKKKTEKSEPEKRTAKKEKMETDKKKKRRKWKKEKNGRKRNKIGSDTVPVTPFAKSRKWPLRSRFLRNGSFQ